MYKSKKKIELDPSIARIRGVLPDEIKEMLSKLFEVEVVVLPVYRIKSNRDLPRMVPMGQGAQDAFERDLALMEMDLENDTWDEY